jgi:hypothetical protein
VEYTEDLRRQCNDTFALNATIGNTSSGKSQSGAAKHGEKNSKRKSALSFCDGGSSRIVFISPVKSKELSLQRYSCVVIYITSTKLYINV